MQALQSMISGSSEETGVLRRSGRRFRPYELRLRDYLKPIRVVSRFGKSERDAISLAHDFLHGLRETDLLESVPLSHPDFSEMSPVLVPRRYRVDLVLRDESLNAVGVVFNHLPYVNTDFRGMGYGSMMVRISDHLNERLLKPSHYSPEGFFARISAHRQHASRALERGLCVPDEVISEYEVRGGSLRLRAPWGIDEQNMFSGWKMPEQDVIDAYSSVLTSITAMERDHRSALS